MVGIIVFLSAASLVLFALIVLPLLCLMPFGWKNEYAPGFYGVGAIIWSTIGLIPAVVAAGLVLARYAEMDRATRLIGLAPGVLLLLAIATGYGLVFWHDRRA